MDSQAFMRPKSAPAFNIRSDSNADRFLARVQSNSNDKTSDSGENEHVSLAETMNKFRTTHRVLQRWKERRRTEAEINITEKPSGLLAAELPTRKMSQIELENVLARVCRPTVSHNARIASNRRINARDIYVPPPVLHVQYFTFESENERFKGTRPISSKNMNSLVNRLSTFDPKRRPAESRRAQTPDLQRQLGPLASYRWKGIKNC